LTGESSSSCKNGIIVVQVNVVVTEKTLKVDKTFRVYECHKRELNTTSSMGALNLYGNDILCAPGGN
jgi:hypothetical protein